MQILTDYVLVACSLQNVIVMILRCNGIINKAIHANAGIHPQRKKYDSQIH